MTSKRKFSAALAVGLTAGLLSQTSTAAEEVVVVYRAKPALEVEATPVRIELKGYLQSLNENFKATLDKDLKQIAAPKIELAVGEISTRG